MRNEKKKKRRQKRAEESWLLRLCDESGECWC
jgi:hypothetical protein